MDRSAITGDIVATWFRLGENRLTLCFCVNRRHAQHVCERLIEAGIAAEYVDGETSRDERKAIYGRFARGETRVIAGVGVMTTGLDLPMTSCIVDAAPTKSRALFVQKIGRGLRTAAGKDLCVIIDHAGNHNRLGRVTEINQGNLDDGDQKKRAKRKKREASEPKPRFCEDCTAILSPRATKCENCGKTIHANTTIQAVEGELVELGSRRTGAAAPTIGDKISFHGELLWIAHERGHKPGWVGHKYKERFGVWPNDPRVRTASPREPGLKTKNWLRSRAIAFAKRRSA
jgi:DNA repair protein RadD